MRSPGTNNRAISNQVTHSPRISSPLINRQHRPRNTRNNPFNTRRNRSARNRCVPWQSASPRTQNRRT